MDITKATAKYETWLRENTKVLESELDLKHKNMAENPFSFFRAVFYRWIQLFNENFDNFKSVPNVLGVGDLHIENYGTWRDAEGRLVWGVNDFDEAYSMPYTNDLIRLTSSAHIAIEENHLKISKPDASESILKGYCESLNSGGNPYVLSESHKWLYDTAAYRLKEPAKFWNKLNSFAEVTKDVPDGILKSLLESMPGRSRKYKVVQRIAGLGSLGRQRFAAISEWNGGLLAREGKAYVSSAYKFINKQSETDSPIPIIMENAVRCPDPYFFVKKKWICRRLAPDCSRIDLASLPEEHDEQKLLYSMGWETANIHLGSKNSYGLIQKDLASREKNWLHNSAEIMLESVKSDYLDWVKEYNKQVNKT